MSPALLETVDSVPCTSLPHRQYFHLPSLICYLDLSELTFSQSQCESSLGSVFHELHISRCSHHSFIHSPFDGFVNKRFIVQCMDRDELR